MTEMSFFRFFYHKYSQWNKIEMDLDDGLAEYQGFEIAKK